MAVEHDTGHDIHFLERLARVAVREADLALRLYRDRTLVRAILADRVLPDDCERVAIAIAAGETPPHVLVQCSGAFVTCLGSGMTIADTPTVGWDRVQVHVARADRAEALADALREAKGEGLRALLAQMTSAGPALRADQIAPCLAVAPMLAEGIWPLLSDTLQTLMGGGRRMAQLKRPRATDPMVAGYYRSFFMLGHMTVMVGACGREVSDRWLDSNSGPIPCFLSVATFAHTALMTRALWALCQLGKPALPYLKKHVTETGYMHGRLTAIVALVGLAVRHRPLRAEIGRVVARAELLPDAHEGEAHALKVTQHIMKTLGDGDLPVAITDELLRSLASSLQKVGNFAERIDANGKISPEDAVTFVANLQRNCRVYGADWILIALAIPFIARAPAVGLYGDAEQLDFAGAKYDPEGQWEVVTAIWRWHAEPIQAEARPGRNDACPCGSGKKYKRCCG